MVPHSIKINNLIDFYKIALPVVKNYIYLNQLTAIRSLELEIESETMYTSNTRMYLEEKGPVVKENADPCRPYIDLNYVWQIHRLHY